MAKLTDVISRLRESSGEITDLMERRAMAIKLLACTHSTSDARLNVFLANLSHGLSVDDARYATANVTPWREKEYAEKLASWLRGAGLEASIQRGVDSFGVDQDGEWFRVVAALPQEDET